MTAPGRLAALTGASVDELHERFGEARTVRNVSGAEWRIYELAAGSLRLRVIPAADPAARGRVASWTLTLAEPADTLRLATEPLGLWPAAGPDVVAADVAQPLVRRALEVSGAVGRAEHTLTATVRYGRITQISAFDEAPDWR